MTLSDESKPVMSWPSFAFWVLAGFSWLVVIGVVVWMQKMNWL